MSSQFAPVHFGANSHCGVSSRRRRREEEQGSRFDLAPSGSNQHRRRRRRRRRVPGLPQCTLGQTYIVGISGGAGG